MMIEANTVQHLSEVTGFKKNIKGALGKNMLRYDIMGKDSLS